MDSMDTVQGQEVGAHSFSCGQRFSSPTPRPGAARPFHLAHGVQRELLHGGTGVWASAEVSLEQAAGATADGLNSSLPPVTPLPPAGETSLSSHRLERGESVLRGQEPAAAWLPPVTRFWRHHRPAVADQHSRQQSNPLGRYCCRAG